MDQVVETLGYKLTGELDEEKAQRLAENPYTFRPVEAKMASLHAKLARQLEQAPRPTSRGSATIWRPRHQRDGRPLAYRVLPTWLSGCRMNATWRWCARRCQNCRKSRSTPFVRAWKTPRCRRYVQGALFERIGKEQGVPNPMPRPWPICAGHWPPATAAACAPTSC